MTDFAAIDFETANEHPTSVCSVGIVTVRDGEIADRFYALIQPEPNFYRYWNTRVHGLTCRDTDGAKVFPYVWEQAEPVIEGLPLVAHNKAFDQACLRAAMRCYQMDWPDYNFFCTLIASKRLMPHLPDHKLPTVAAACGHFMTDHHNALADAEACAAIALQIL